MGEVALVEFQPWVCAEKQDTGGLELVQKDNGLDDGRLDLLLEHLPANGDGYCR